MYKQHHVTFSVVYLLYFQSEIGMEKSEKRPNHDNTEVWHMFSSSHSDHCEPKENLGLVNSKR